MKKVLIVVEGLIDNGLGRYTREIIDRLCNHYKVYILTSNPGTTDWKKLNIPVFLLPSMKKMNSPLINFWYSLKYLSLAKEVDFIHFCSEFPYCVLFSQIPLFKKTRFITAHGTYAVAPLDHYFYRFFLKRAFKKANKVICVSNFTKKQILKRIKLRNTIVVNNGVDFNKFYQPGINLPLKSGKVILSVGLLKNRKGFDVSLLAIAKLKLEFPNLKYYIVGDQSDVGYFNYLKDLVEKNSLKENVIFLENISDAELIQLYYFSDVFILTPIMIKGNKFEGFGLVYLEAGACSKPVIGTFSCGAEDAIIDGYNGFLVPPNDIEATVLALTKILTDKELAEKMGRNGREFARRQDWDNVFKKYQAVYESFIN